MSISGVVITFESEDTASRFRQALAGTHQGIECGELCGLRMPAVVDAADDAEALLCVQWIESQSGVVRVDVAFVALDDRIEPALSRVESHAS